MIRMTLVVLAAIVACALLRRRSAALRHWLLFSALLCAGILPLLAVLTPAWNWPGASGVFSPSEPLPVAVVTEFRLADAATQRTIPPEPAGLSALSAVGRLARYVWFSGAVIGLIMLAAGLWRLRQIARSAAPVSAASPWAEALNALGDTRTGRVGLLESERPGLLIAFGVMRPRIILPSGNAEWHRDRIHAVLLHEIAHLRRGDALMMIVAHTIRAIYWFNPLVWVACRRLREESERACDDAVLAAGVPGLEYASQLSQLARLFTARHAHLPAPAMARPSSLRSRVGAILNPHVDRAPLSPIGRFAVPALVMSVTIAVASAQSMTSLTGQVFDSTGAVVANARVGLTNEETLAKFEVRSDAQGMYEFAALPPGRYAMQTFMPGFSNGRTAIEVQGRALRRDITLRIGALEETITIKRASETASQAAAPRPVVRQARPVTCQTPADGGHIVQPRKIRSVNPIYPAVEDGVAGVVILEATISPQGSIDDVKVLRTPHEALAAAAVEAVRQWEFTPTLLNCRPVPVIMTATLNFERE